MIISLKDLATAPQGRISFEYTIDLSQEEVNFEHPFAEPVLVAGQLSDDAGMIRLTARVSAAVHTRCARCNRPLVLDKEVDVDFALVHGRQDAVEQDDIIALDSDKVDIDSIVVPELILDMDMAVLCGEDCKGLCPTCGKNLNEGDCGCRQKTVDPRLEALKNFLPRE